MLKLYMVLRVAGAIGGVAGPLPLNFEDCEVESKSMTRDVVEKAEARALTGDTDLRTDVASWVFSCEYYDARPKLDPVR